MHAFRCHTCGYLCPSEHAGECDHPHACVVCGSGISFDPKTGKKIINTENWEILCDCTKERLDELGLDGEVERHVPTKQHQHQGRVVDVETHNILGIQQRTQ